MKLAVQTFDQGKPKEEGTVEEWWAGPNSWRVAYALPSFTGGELHTADGVFRTKGAGYEPTIVDDLLQQVIHPFHDEHEIDDSKPDLRKQKFGKVELDCIMLDQPLKNVASPPLGLFPTFCLDPGKDSLRINVETGSVIFVRNRTGVFQGRSVPMDMRAQSDDDTVGTSHLDTLSSMTPEEMDLKPGPEMEKVGAQAALIGAGVIAGNIISKVQPVYPETAKHDHVSGTVKLHAIIGRDGRVRSLRVLSTPDSDLAISALRAVRQWTYKPYLVNGMPTEVDTTLMVNYAFSPR